MLKKLTKCLNEHCPLGYSCLRKLAQDYPQGQQYSIFLPEKGEINGMNYIKCTFYIKYFKPETNKLPKQ